MLFFRINPLLGRALATTLWLATAAGHAVGEGNAPPTPKRASGAPDGIAIEAEAHLAGGTAATEDATASGGKAAVAKRDWQPIVSAAVPAGDGELSLWVRYRGGAFQLKTVAADKQTDRDWVWGGADVWTWVRLGRYARAELGESFLLMRGQGDREVAIDQVVFAADPAAHPAGVAADGKPLLPPEAPDPAAAATSARVAVDWERPAGTIGPLVWGMNDYEICDPAKAVDPAYNDALAAMRPGLIRVHWAGLPDAWTDAATRTWNPEKIRAGFAGLRRGYGDARVMLNVPWWPAWLAAEPDGTLPPGKEDEFVALVGRLVDVLRDAEVPVDYWEMLNERDETYAKAGKLDRLWALQNRLFAEVRRHNPKAKVGGPAFTWPKPEWVEGFLKACGPNIDFLTWHNYASGDRYNANDKIFALTDTIRANAAYVKEAAVRLVPGKKLETFLTEYNVQWNWEPYERRHGNAVGAVFDACVLARMARLGVDGVTVWHAKGHAYGLVDGDNTIRPPGVLYTWGRKYLTGKSAEVSVDRGEEVEALAVIRDDGSRSLLLANKTDHAVRLGAEAAALVGRPASAVAQLRITAAIAERVPAPATAGPVELPGYSLTLLTTAGQ